MMLLIRIGNKMLLVWRCPPLEEEHIEKHETLLVGRGAQKKEQCRDEDETLLVRIGYKKLLVWRSAPQEEEHIETDETLLVERGVQKKVQCISADETKYKSHGALRGCDLGVRDCLQVCCGK